MRDLLLGREPKDFDIATRAHPDEIKALLMEFEGECPVLLELETKDALKVLLQSVDIQGVNCAREMIERLEDLLGDNAVIIQY